MMLMLAALLAGQAQAAETVQVGMKGPPDGFGIGVVLGEPSGIALGFRGGGAGMVQANVGWSVPSDRFHLSVDYLFTIAELKTAEAPNLTFPFYVGLGGQVRAGDWYGRYYNDPGVGLRVPVGMQLVPSTVSLDVFLEIVPVLLVLPATDVGIDAGLGIRFYPF